MQLEIIAGKKKILKPYKHNTSTKKTQVISIKISEAITSQKQFSSFFPNGLHADKASAGMSAE